MDALLDALEGKGMPAPSVDGSSEGADGGGHKPLSKVVLARRWKVRRPALPASVIWGYPAGLRPCPPALPLPWLRRCTWVRRQVDLEGRVDPLELLEALQDRDSRPYQLLLRMPNGDILL